ncbi:MAG: hypothetical protein ACYDAS_02935 [Patescibacteria group bacterium]
MELKGKILKSTYIKFIAVPVVFLLLSVIYTLFKTATVPSVQFTPFNGFNPAESLSQPKAATTIYASNNEIIGKIYGPEMKAYQYVSNPSAYAGHSILYHLENIPPYSSDPNVLSLAMKAKNDFMQFLYKGGAITKSDITLANQNTNTPYFSILHTPYFTEYVIHKLYQNYQKYLLLGGLQVYTTVNPTLNTLAQQIVTSDFQKYDVPIGADSAAMVADNPTNGYVLAMIGGPNNGAYLNMADVPRQQGSAMKPLIYVKAFEMGYSPQTMIDDSPICYGNYCPTDYEGYTVGWVSIDRAINQSINIPAIKMLARIGYQNGFNTLLKEGIQLNPKVYVGLPLVLGAAGIPLVRMVGAYNALNNGGYYAQSTPFIKIVYNNQTILNNTNPPKNRILNANAVAEMDAVLGDTALKAPLYGSYTYYYSVQGRPYGSKDGTSNGPRDITDYMFIPQITVGVWAGNINDSLMSQNAVGAFQTGPIAHQFIMDYIKNNNLPIVNFPTPTYPTLNSTTATIP